MSQTKTVAYKTYTEKEQNSLCKGNESAIFITMNEVFLFTFRRFIFFFLISFFHTVTRLTISTIHYRFKWKQMHYVWRAKKILCEFQVYYVSIEWNIYKHINTFVWWKFSLVCTMLYQHSIELINRKKHTYMAILNISWAFLLYFVLFFSFQE